MARFLTVLVVLASSAGVAAQDSSRTTRLVPFSGVLADGAGAPRSGPQRVTFALFDAQEGGAALWTETQLISADERGRYTAHLGTVVALPLDIFRTEQARWLEVAVAGATLPRFMLVAVPYALKAADAETLAGRPASAFVVRSREGHLQTASGEDLDAPLVDGTGVPNQLAKWNGPTTLSSSVVAESADNRIGIFAPDPTGGGVVDARFTIRHLDNNTAIGVLNTANQRRFALNTLATGGFTLYDGGSGTWNAGLTQENSRVAITNPNSGAAALLATNGFIGAVDGFGVRGRAVNGNGFGYGGFFEGGFRGVVGHVIAGAYPGTGFGVHGVADGTAGARYGVIGEAINNGGVIAYGIYGSAQGAATNWAGWFQGNVHVTGTLSKSAGTFKIDHPLDPANKYLSHSFVESPDMKNIYDGLVTTDAHGEATVTLPDWFDALNRDVRYQLTVIGQFAQAIVAEKVTGNRFRIKTDKPGVEVSWQLTGIRKDQYAEDHRIQVEEPKLPGDRGTCLHAPLCGGAALGTAAPDEEEQRRKRRGTQSSWTRPSRQAIGASTATPRRWDCPTT